MADKDTLRITELTIENVKRVHAVHIRPGGAVVVEIGGNNAQGKSSVLDGLEMLLCGTRSLCPEPIRRGEDKAVICGEVSNADGLAFTVTRRFAMGEDGTTSSKLEMRSPHGGKIPAPQSVLDSIVGNLAFDPLAIYRMTPKQHGEALRKAIGLDFDAIDAARAKAFANRTIVNRDLKAADSSLSVMVEPPAGTPDEEVSASAVASELTDAIAINAGREAANQTLQDRKSRLEQLRREIEMAEEAVNSQVAHMRNLPDTVDVDVIRARLDETEQVNANVRAKLARAEKQRAVARLQDESANLTAKIEKCDAERAEMLAGAEMPVDGLGLDEDGDMVFNGLPLEQAAHSEKLRVACGLAMAGNPKLRLMRVYDGSLLDDGGMEIMGELAEKHDIQVWIERVGTEGSGIIIEDGSIVEPKAKGGVDNDD